MKCKARFFQILTLAALAQPLIAVAHPFHWASESIGFVDGLIHPLTGADHVLAMSVLGLWLSQADRRLVYVMPFIFMGSMLMGCGLTLIPIEIAYAEHAEYLCVLMLSLMSVSGRKLSLLADGLIVAGVGVLHGYLHAYDVWLDVDAVAYTAGFSLVSVMLIAAGTTLGTLLIRLAVKFSSDRLAERN